MEKEIIWTAQAKGDLQHIYYFNTLALRDEVKAFKLIENIIKKTEQLNRKISGGTRYISDLNPAIPYQKLVSNITLLFTVSRKIESISIRFLTHDKILKN